MPEPARAVDWIAAIGTAAGAVATFGAVVVALFPDHLKDLISPASARFELDDSLKELTQFARGPSPGAGSLVYMVHLRIRNTSRRRALHRCSLVLEELSWPAENGWRTEVLPVALNLRWAPFEMRPLEIDLRAGEHATANLLWFYEVNTDWLVKPDREWSGVVKPVLAGEPTNFAGTLTAAGTIRYHLALRADELRTPVRGVFEVHWTGRWPGDRERFEDVLQVIRRSAAASLVASG